MYASAEFYNLCKNPEEKHPWVPENAGHFWVRWLMADIMSAHLQSLQEGGLGIRALNNELPDLYNIEMDPREQINITADNAWVFRHYLKIIADYKKSLVTYPNPPAVSLTNPGL